MSTYNATVETAQHNWYLIDATNKTLGRLATEIARRLRGKHKATFTPHVDTGDYIIVIHAENLRVTGRKASDKIYYRNTGFPGGIRSINFQDWLAKDAAAVLENAVKGMLPKGPLGRQTLKKLKVYSGAEHPHTAQTPQILEIKED